MGGIEAWVKRVRIILLIVWILRSTFPFCEDVRGQEKRKFIPCCLQKLWNALLSYSRPLSHYKFLILQLNSVDT